MGVVALSLAAAAGLALLVATFTLPGGGTTQAQNVAFDSNSGCTAATANGASWSTHDVGAGNNRLLLVGVSFRSEADTQTVNTVTWDADGAGGNAPVALSVVA